MNIISMGYNHVHDENFVIDRPLGIDSWLLLLVKTPSIFLNHGQPITVKTPAFIIYEANIPQYYRACSNRYVDDWIHFLPSDKELLLLHNLSLPLNTITPINDITDLSGIVRTMTYEYYSDKEYRLELADLYFSILLYTIRHHLLYDPQRNSNLNSVHFYTMHKLRNDIYNNPEQERSVDSMALELSMSRSAFQHNYKKFFGQSVMTDIINSRLHRVELYLTTTTMTLSQIAQLCGYNNEIHLIRQFKQYYGVTPTEYRIKS